MAEWQSGSGRVAVAEWQWQSGSGRVAVAEWQWQSGSGRVAVAEWQWQSGSGRVVVPVPVAVGEQVESHLTIKQIQYTHIRQWWQFVNI